MIGFEYRRYLFTQETILIRYENELPKFITIVY